MLVFILCSFNAVFVCAAGTCLNDPNNGRFNNPNCVADDVKIAQLNIISAPVSCVAGTTIQVQLQAHTVATANQRYDVGYFIALNGNDARTGDCYHDYLPPPLSKVTNGMNSPYYDGDNDQCGDIKKNINTIRNIGADVSMSSNAPPIMLTVLCNDSNGNGTVDVSACTSWDNNTKGACMSAADAYPETPSKCNCDNYELNINVEVGCQSASDCNDNNPCTDQICENHACVYMNKISGTPCDDQNLCSTNDQCNGAGQCIGTPVFCSGDICHNAGTCDLATGLCNNPNKTDGTKCDNGDPCSVNDKCISGECVGTPATCNTPGLCQVGPGQCEGGTCYYNNAPPGTSCNGDTGQCDDNGGCGEGDACNISSDCVLIECLIAECVESICTYSQDFNCFECTPETVDTDCLGALGDNCIIATCDPNTLQCIYSSKLCSSGVDCLIDSCDPQIPGGCFSTPDDSLCPTGDQCSEPICTTQGCELEPTTGNPCISNVPCEVNAVCFNGICAGINSCEAPDSCSTADCDFGQCVISTCLAPTYCNEESSACVQCGPGHACEGDLVCNQDGICVGCESDFHCVSGDPCVIGTCLNQECHYNLNQACVPSSQCLIDAQCISQDQCVLGSCVDKKCEYRSNPDCLPANECEISADCKTNDRCIIGDCIEGTCFYSLDQTCIPSSTQPCPAPAVVPVPIPTPTPIPVPTPISVPTPIPVATPAPVVVAEPQPVEIAEIPVVVPQTPAVEAIDRKYRSDNVSVLDSAPKSDSSTKPSSCANTNAKDLHLWILVLLLLWMSKRARQKKFNTVN